MLIGIVVVLLALALVGMILIVWRHEDAGRALRRMLSSFDTPDEIVESYLGPDEEVLHQDSRAFSAFVIEEPRNLLVPLFSLLLLGTIATQASLEVVLLAFLLLDITVMYLIVKRLTDLYTRYVLTNFRVMKVSGILSRSNYSVPWSKIQDFTWRQSLRERFFNYATIIIHSAVANQGLDRLDDLRDPHKFYWILEQKVRERQGAVSSDVLDRQDVIVRREGQRVYTERLPSTDDTVVDDL